MRNAQGYASISGPLLPGAQAEYDTFTCGHCQFVVHVPVRCAPEDMGGRCGNCERLICPKCVQAGTCTPWEEAIAKMERRTDALRSYEECSD